MTAVATRRSGFALAVVGDARTSDVTAVARRSRERRRPRAARLSLQRLPRRRFLPRGLLANVSPRALVAAHLEPVARASLLEQLDLPRAMLLRRCRVIRRLRLEAFGVIKLGFGHRRNCTDGACPVKEGDRADALECA